MVGANGPVRGPHPNRASEQEKEIQGGMVGKEERGAVGKEESMLERGAEARC